jgi:hypothetical protein
VSEIRTLYLISDTTSILFSVSEFHSYVPYFRQFLSFLKKVNVLDIFTVYFKLKTYPVTNKQILVVKIVHGFTQKNKFDVR